MMRKLHIRKWVEKWPDTLRDLSTIIAVLFAALLAGLLTGENPTLTFPSSFLSTHPYLSFLTIVVGALLLIFLILVFLGDYWTAQAKSSP
jgi:hypothetical protein